MLFVRSPFIGLQTNISAYEFRNIMVTKSMVRAQILELGDHGTESLQNSPIRNFVKESFFEVILDGNCKV